MPTSIDNHSKRRGMRHHPIPTNIEKINRSEFDIAKVLRRKRFLSLVNAGRIARTTLVVHSKDEAENITGETMHWQFAEKDEIEKIRMTGQILVFKRHDLDEAKRRIKERPFPENFVGFVGVKDAGGYAKHRHGIELMSSKNINV